MRICIVGARGFIGSRLLGAPGVRESAVAVERSSFLSRPGQPPAALTENPLVKCSVAYFLVDAPEPSRTNQSVVNRNLRTFECFLSCAARAKVRKIVLVSSGGAVYGEPDYLPIDEYHARRPVSAYGEMMLGLENALVNMALNVGCAAIILRLSNVYGRVGRVHANQGVIEHFARCLRAGDPMTVRGSPLNIRDFLHIDDCIAALTAARRLEESTTLNVGTGIGTSVRELGYLMAQIHGLRPIFTQDESHPVY